MSDRETYECSQCDDTHPVSFDSDGYGLVWCRSRGTTLVSKPEETEA